MSGTGASRAVGRTHDDAAGDGLGRDVVVDHAALFAQIPTSYLVMSPVAPDYRILDANEAYLANVGRALEEIVGTPVFEAFPPTAETLDEHGVPWIRSSFDRAVATGRPDAMPLQKYDVPDPETGGMVERYWSLISVPILDAEGRVALLVQRAENVTDFVQESRRHAVERERGEHWERRAMEVEADLFARAEDLAAALRAKDVASRRLASLADVTLRVGSADSVAELIEVVFGSGLPVLDASGGSIAVREPGQDVLHLTVTPSLGGDVQRAFGELPLDGPMPSSIAARGSLVLVPNRAAAAGYPGLLDAMALTAEPTHAWAVLPLQIGPRLLGSLAVAFASERTFPAEEVELLRAFAAQCAQALDRLQVRDAERRRAAEVRSIAETLQRGLLTSPPPSDDLEFAVSYQPAQRVAQVGGDWYDVFHTPDGTAHLVIGDVAGHDQDAAAAMAQVRNILRGIAQTRHESPAVVLGALDDALHHLQLDVIATLVVAQVRRSSDGSRLLLWSNAGHPPPVLQRADGRAELLDTPPDLLIGARPGADRHDHSITLTSGDHLLLYTDGLVETRGGDLAADLERLVRRVGEHDPARGPQTLLEHVGARLTAHDDDIALLCARAR
ncbi:SpoIIE family protein phosphatase [Cellulomonas sp. 179-A 4D5 NHS]|uniref:SpoIIE family protein phosphatase n=1 Tax=Cellulomonas sp. 179-A 4D5 NHS TaxID=3142378 RepID=UPI0039A30C2B